MAQEYLYLDDYNIGDKIITPARTITETDIVNFAGITGDWHPLHTDVEYAAQTPFKKRIAHGMLTLCVGMVLPVRLGPFCYLPKSFIAFYGMENVRFTAPTRIGDTIHCEAEVIGIDSKGESKGVVTMQNIIKNQKGEVAVSYKTQFLCGKKPK